MIFEYKNTKVNYILMNNFLDGDTPVVYLHGWGGGTSSFLFCAKKIDRPSILIDFPPFGESQTPKIPFDVVDYAKIVEGILKRHNVTAFDVVAHSFGGRVATQLCADGCHVRRLVLTGSAGIKKRSLRVKFKVFRYKFLKLLCKLKLYNASKLPRGSSDYANLPPVMKKTFCNVVNYDQRKLIGKISCPTLLIWGKDDAETPFYFTNFYKKHIKDCEVVSLHGGHFAYLDNASQFILIVTSFLQ